MDCGSPSARNQGGDRWRLPGPAFAGRREMSLDSGMLWGLRTVVVVAVFLVIGCALRPAGAQQPSPGSPTVAAPPPGSPAATTSIDGAQLPPPPPKFGGVIKPNAVQS